MNNNSIAKTINPVVRRRILDITWKQKTVLRKAQGQMMFILFYRPLAFCSVSDH